jgi:cytochrome P450
MLLGATTPDGAPLDDASLRDELMTLLATGYETTATALAWAFQLVHLNPAVEERLRAELASLGPDPDPLALSREAPYLRAVCDETLRLRPILPVVARRALAPVEIDGWLIPAGVTIAASIYLAHHRPEVYPDPDAFLPERFFAREHTPYEYLPFGGGPRRCLGMTLALHEMRIVLGTILSRVTLSPLVRDLRAARRTVTLGPAGSVPMRVVRTSNRP